MPDKRIKIIEIFKKNILLIILIGICIMQTMITPKFFSLESLVNIVIHAAYVGIIAIGITLVILIGGIDLSVGSTVALAGCILAGLEIFNGLPIMLCFTASILLTIIVGLIIGSLVVFIRIPPFIVTLAAMYIVRGVVLVYTKQTPISGLSPSLHFLGVGNVVGIPTIVVIWLSIAILFNFILKHTIFGETLYAIGQNEQVANLSGLKIIFVKLTVFIINALLAGLTGILLTARLDSAQPTMGQGWEFEAIACTVIGGTSLMGGTANIGKVVLGTLIITIIRTGLNMMGMPADLQQVIIGLLLIAVVSIDSASRHR